MGNSFRQSMAWLHTWTGLLLGWVLYLVFVTGTLAYLDTEIDRWMKPELPPARSASSETMARAALDYLERHAAQARRWSLVLPLDRNDPYIRLSWVMAGPEGAAARGKALLDPLTGAALAARETGGGQALYQLHWRLHYVSSSAGEWIVGVASMMMLVAIVTGIIVHKKIFADFFTFRRGKGQRTWLDAHNAAAVLSLPFQLMITYSGLVFLMFTYMPLVIAAWYGTGEQNHQRFSDQVFVAPPQLAPSGMPAPLVGPSLLFERVQAQWGHRRVGSIDIEHPGDRHARVTLRGDFAAGPLRAVDAITFDGVSGAVLDTRPAIVSQAKAFRDLMAGLHEGLFAGPALRVMYILSGLMGAAMLATGLILWTVKRRQRLERGRVAAHAGLRLVERLNVASIVGLPVGIAAYFWANRLLPLDLAARADWEMHGLFLSWAAMFAHASARPPAHAWREQCWCAAAAFALLPVINAVTTARGLPRSLIEEDWVMAGFDLAALALGLGFGVVGAYLGKRQGAEAGNALPAPAGAHEGTG